MKVLVAYFSHTGENYGVGFIEKGNTRIIAEMIAGWLGTARFCGAKFTGRSNNSSQGMA